MGYKLKAVPQSILILVIAAALLAVFSAMNFVYQVVRKPTEVFSPVSREFIKSSIDTWRQYAPLFREYSNTSLSPELLAALAQVEGAGNPVASTYWWWRLTWNPLELYQPASSSVGMYQMTDAAFAEVRHYCIRHHTVVEEGCSFNGLHTRLVPSHAVELAAMFLDHNVTAVLAHRPRGTAGRQHTQELAVIIHLCGAVSAEAFARRGLHLGFGERCGDHDVAAYLAQINAAKREFLRLAADR